MLTRIAPFLHKTLIWLSKVLYCWWQDLCALGHFVDLVDTQQTEPDVFARKVLLYVSNMFCDSEEIN